ncbi:hypothetical protein HCA69_15410 [Listeria grandensis]|uniref:Uncharacterized protein n=1 Tax=Listeria grandensis TaxID=1494963 RepID=A0A7X0Y684_9LIST|nr:hypothetical protein [Listeria grandensis]MBC1937756.1 hypothetical protein [Listeria grandensis]
MATVTFTVFGFVGAKMQINLSFIVEGLFAALFFVIVTSLISIFFPLRSLMSMNFAEAGTLMFSLYTGCETRCDDEGCASIGA